MINTHWEEQVLDGVLCWRSTAIPSWTPYSPQELTRLVQAYQTAYNDLNAAVAAFVPSISSKEEAK